VDSDRPWTAPAQHVVVGRKWKYAPPARLMYEAVVDELEQWLPLQAGEVMPKVAATRKADRVLLRPWVDPVITAVELQLEQDGYGSAMTVLAYGDVPQLPDETRRRVRHRLGTIFGAALREWVDEPR
jgi:CTP:molybdopterin cytidylyltransferase MocA